MANLTPQQIAQYAYNAGFRGAALNQAVAIAIAESGGRTDAYNPETAAGTKNGSGSRGLWQIYGTAHPEFNNSSAFDPQVNANAAFKVFREAGNRFSPWSTFNQGIASVRYDFSKLTGTKKSTTAKSKNSKPRAGAVQKVARGSTDPVTQTSTTTTTTTPAAKLPASAIDTTATAEVKQKTLKDFLGLSDSSVGPKSSWDIAFIIIGGVLMVVGVYAFLVIGVGKAAYDNRDTIAEVAKIAAIA
jgi:hypothetical protein